MAEARSKVFSIGTTPTFSHTKPPAKLANCDKITESVFAATKIPEVSLSSLFCFCMRKVIGCLHTNSFF